MTTCKKNRTEHRKHCKAEFSSVLTEFDRGKCCVCVRDSKAEGLLPPCYFTDEQIERSKDFSIERFVELHHICVCKEATAHDIGTFIDKVVDGFNA